MADTDRQPSSSNVILKRWSTSYPGWSRA